MLGPPFIRVYVAVAADSWRTSLSSTALSPNLSHQLPLPNSISSPPSLPPAGDMAGTRSGRGQSPESPPSVGSVKLEPHHSTSSKRLRDGDGRVVTDDTGSSRAARRRRTSMSSN